VLCGLAGYFYRAPLKTAITGVGLRIAAPFVRDLTAPALAERDKAIQALRSQQGAEIEALRSQQGTEIKALRSQQEADVQALKSEVGKLRESLGRTGVRQRAQLRAIGSRLEAIEGETDGAGASQSLVPVVSMLGATPLYSKGDRVEIYGANLRQFKSGPIRITESLLEIEKNRAVLAWWPRHSTIDQASHVRVRLSEDNDAEHGALHVFIRLKDDTVLKFTARLDEAATPAAEAPPVTLPADIKRLFDDEIDATTLTRAGEEFTVELPAPVRAHIAALGDDPIGMMVIAVEGAAAGSSLGISEVSLAAPASNRTGSVTLVGKIHSDSQVDGAVELTDVNGAVREARISDDHAFVFAGVRKGQPVSLKVKSEDIEYFPDQGRWIVPMDDTRLTIHVEPAYVNRDGHPPNPAEREWGQGGTPTGGALYGAHARLRWNGASQVQRFDSYTFTNSWGYVDRDRFVDNVDHCYRIVHIGSSHAVSIQVGVSQKYNQLLEEELGVKLKRCVEVISAGRDNGDVGANYPSVSSYAVLFKPDLIILDVQSSLLMQLDHDLSRLYLGWDPDHSGIGRLEYGPDGRLAYHPPSPNYALYTKPRDWSQSFVPGVHLFETLKVQWDKLPDVARRTFRQFGDIMKFYRESFPGARFVLETGVEMAQCAASFKTCDREVTEADGTKISVGATSFLANLKRVCRDNQLECLELRHYRYEADPDKPLVFFDDGHYTVRGHQWFAHELAHQIYDKLISPKQ
jgi:hypothetical protein